MGLVHRQQVDPGREGKIQESGAGQPFRRHIDQLVPALPGPLQSQGVLAGGEAAVQKRRRYPHLHQGHHLIPHQGDQGGYNKGDALLHQGRDLEADRFARPGGHDGQHILPAAKGTDDLFLPRAEPVVAVISF